LAPVLAVAPVLVAVAALPSMITLVLPSVTTLTCWLAAPGERLDDADRLPSCIPVSP